MLGLKGKSGPHGNTNAFKHGLAGPGCFTPLAVKLAYES